MNEKINRSGPFMKTACMFQKQRFKIVYRKSGVVYPGLEFQPELPEQINEFLVFGSWFKELQPQQGTVLLKHLHKL